MILNIVIDANVFKSYYEAVVHNTTSLLTGCPKKVFDNLGVLYLGYIDEAGIIKHEWENLVDRQWFDAWYGEMLILSHLNFIEPYRDNGLESKITSYGFPAGRDINYVRVSRQVAEQQKYCIFITEDLDFFDPPHKKSSEKTRTKILMGSLGNVNKTLRKFSVDVKCVANV